MELKIKKQLTLVTPTFPEEAPEQRLKTIRISQCAVQLLTVCGANPSTFPLKLLEKLLTVRKSFLAKKVKET